ncbi:hypothetical protein TNCV_3673871 [Trichonephila clavipes]|nr:hypothetical protein TNCV_3673871 [Trichonephila clavipes]
MLNIFEGTPKYRRAARHLLRLVEGEARWEVLVQLRVFSFKIGMEPYQIVVPPVWCPNPTLNDWRTSRPLPR